jgi:hypothetical protein
MVYKLVICAILLLCSGCSLLENIGGWNLSACQDNLGVCWELYWDNRSHFNNGFTAGLSELENK